MPTTPTPHDVPATPPAPAVGFFEVVHDKAFVIVGLTILGVGTLATLEYLRPNRDNGAMSMMVATAFAALLAYFKSEQSHKILNSRMTEWLTSAEHLAESRGYNRAIQATALQALQDTERTLREARQIVVDRQQDAAEVLRVAQDRALLEHTAATSEDLARATAQITQAVEAAVAGAGQKNPPDEC